MVQDDDSQCHHGPVGSKGWTVVGLLAIGAALTGAYFVGRESADVSAPPDDTAADRALDQSITTNQERIREHNDVAARQQARDLAAFLEGCFSRTQTYVGCDLRRSGLPLGETEGNVNAVAMSGAAFVVRAVSRSGCAYTVEKRADGAIVRSATGAGCRSDRW